MIAASPNLIRDACTPIKPVVTDLLDNLFENECGDTVSLLSLYYEHLSKEHTGSWCSAPRFPWCHRSCSIRVFTFTLVLARSGFLIKNHQRRRSWWVDHHFQWNRVTWPRKRWNRWCSCRDQSFLFQTRECYKPGRLVRILRTTLVFIRVFGW